MIDLNKVKFNILFLILIPFMSVYFCACNNSEDIPLEAGVSETLAAFRKDNLSDIRYNLFFNIPEKLEEPVKAQLNLVFSIKGVPKQPLVIDFNVRNGLDLKIMNESDSIPFEYKMEHLIVEEEYLK